MALKTCEFVSPKHPDKICDFIADSILDAYLAVDGEARVAVEVMGGHGVISVSGEISSKADIDIAAIVKSIVGEGFVVHVYASRQSPEIGRGVDNGGAGDQGIMIGHAVRETENFMPFEYETARTLCKGIYEWFPFDGKVQVTVDGQIIKTVVASFQNTKSSELEALARSLISAEQYLINPAGEWQLGGFDADSGLSGRKLIVDNYGPEYQIGGGSFSGKDFTKVDRSGAYMARKIAVDLLQHYEAQRVMTKLAYAIGKADPVMAVAVVDGKEMDISKDYILTPLAIRESLGLDKVRFAEMTRWGHFGRRFEGPYQKVTL